MKVLGSQMSPKAALFYCGDCMRANAKFGGNLRMGPDAVLDLDRGLRAKPGHRMIFSIEFWRDCLRSESYPVVTVFQVSPEIQMIWVDAQGYAAAMQNVQAARDCSAKCKPRRSVRRRYSARHRHLAVSIKPIGRDPNPTAAFRDRH